MSGFVFAMGPCVLCGAVHSFNIERVPSVDGRPICRDCVDQLNADRTERDVPLIVVYPDSYEPVES